MSDEPGPSRKTRYADGETVYVPAVQFPNPESTEYALVPRQVLGSENRSVWVNVPGRSGETKLIATSKVHSSSLGVLILSIGDVETETTLIEPLQKSMLQFTRLLLPDDMIRNWRVRTTTELKTLWNLHDPWRTFSHVILISHAGRRGLQFLDRPAAVGGAEVGSMLSISKDAAPKVFLSLACESGKADFASSFSKTNVCRELVAPFQTVHGASACQYAQSFLAYHLLDGATTSLAKKRADEATTSGIHFRRWRAGDWDR